MFLYMELSSDIRNQPYQGVFLQVNAICSYIRNSVPFSGFVGQPWEKRGNIDAPFPAGSEPGTAAHPVRPWEAASGRPKGRVVGGRPAPDGRNRCGRGHKK